MPEMNDATDDGGRHINTVSVAAVAAEPEQDEQDEEEETATHGDDCYQPRVVEVYRTHTASLL